MDAVDLLRSYGGCLHCKQLRAHVSRRQLRRSLTSGEVLRVAPGSYALPSTSRGAVLAQQLRGVQSHRSAAKHWGFALPPDPDVDHITVRRNAQRKRTDGSVLHYRSLDPAEVRSGVTSPLQTVVDCLRDLCLREALSVGDSALRSGMVDDAALIARIAVLRGPGSAKVRSRAAMLDARAANAFESSCRAILIDGGVIGFAPQVSIRHQGRFLGRVDLCHQVLRIVIECESFAHHGDRASLRRDCRRYSSLEAAGWRVLRVSWEDVMFEPDWVLSRVRDTVSAAGGPSFEEQRPSGADARPL